MQPYSDYTNLDPIQTETGHTKFAIRKKLTMDITTDTMDHCDQSISKREMQHRSKEDIKQERERVIAKREELSFAWLQQEERKSQLEKEWYRRGTYMNSLEKEIDEIDGREKELTMELETR